MLVSLIKELFKKKSSRDQAEFERALTLVQNSQFSAAVTLLDRLIILSPDFGNAWLLRATCRRRLKMPRDAIADATHALSLNADAGDCHFELAQCWSGLGDTALAIEHGETARRIAPESVPAFFFLTQLRLPGENYVDVLTRIIGHLKPRTYVEIGVFQGDTIRLAKSANAVVGIDPDPKIDGPLESHIKVFDTTSDAFFLAHDLGAELGQQTVDLAFIDGMHQFEFAMRDFANLERYCHRDSVVLVHDCYPLDEESAGREPRATRWSGDVWRLIVLLKKYRPDLSIHTIGAEPTGLAVIQNLDPRSSFLLTNQDRLQQEFVALEYSYLAQDKPAKLNLYPNSWPKIKKILKKRAASVKA